MSNKPLLEKWDALIKAEGVKLKPITEAETMAAVLENQETYVLKEEQVGTGDMAPFFPVLVPAVRRIFPGLLANEIVGVQPMNGPTGYAYAIRFSYGEGAGPKARTGAAPRGYQAPFEDNGLSRGDNPNQPNWQSAAIVLNKASWGAAAPLVFDGTSAVRSIDTNFQGTVVYNEYAKVLVDITTGDDSINYMTSGSDVEFSSNGAFTDTQVITSDYVWGNEAGYNVIFENYSGPVFTEDGELLGRKGDTISEREKEIKTMKMSLERVAAEAKTRKLKAEYSMELAQDLKNVHGLDAEAELINILEYEITAEIDRELVSRINNVATKIDKPWIYATSGSMIAAGTNVSDGRWEQEKFRTLYTRIVKEANTIALTTRRGAGNFIICSTNVATALESLSSFMYSAVPGSVSPQTGVSKVGTLDGRFTVYVDTFATYDYVTVGYKGPSAFDTGVVYMPYIPLMVQKVVDPYSFQPKVGFMQRSAIVENLFGAYNYYRHFLVDFSGSGLEGSSLY
jgi:hypothetical protein